MAKLKKDQPENTTTKVQKTNFSKKFATANSKNEGISPLDEDFAQITEWIDTGSYSLNKIVSGSIYKGFPNARVCALAGAPGTGKSLICGKVMREAINMGYDILFFDTEGDVDLNFYKRVGCDLDHVTVIEVAPGNKVQSIETFRNYLMKDVVEFKKENPEWKPMIILDSFGNLPNEKEINDTLSEKTNSDMGQKQKAAKSMFRLTSTVSSKYKMPFIFTNHIYKDTSVTYDKSIMTGGEGGKYMASIIIFLNTLKLDEEKDAKFKKTDSSTKLGVKIKATCEKNRFVPPSMNGYMYLRFKTGLNKYYGLVDDAVASGAIIPDKKMYYVPHLDKKMFEKYLYTAAVFTKEVLDKIDEYCQKEYAFSGHLEPVDEDALIDEINAAEVLAEAEADAEE
jgi:RecA/RadA recombinase